MLINRSKQSASSGGGNLTPGEGIDITDDVISVKPAEEAELGGMKIWVDKEDMSLNIETIKVYDKEGILKNADFKQIDEICQKGLEREVFAVGDETTFNLKSGEQVTLQILGFRHDDLADNSGKAGITWGLKNALATNYILSSNTRVYSWEETDMARSTLPSIYGLLPDSLTPYIKTVSKKIQGQYTYEPYIISDIFLFSLEEVMGTTYRGPGTATSYGGEGEQYEYYKNAPIPTPNSGTGSFTALNGDSGTFYTTDTNVASGYTDLFGNTKSTSTSYYYNYNNTKALSDINVSSTNWWLRSQGIDSSSTTRWCYIMQGGYATSSSVSGQRGVVFGLCI